MKLTNAMRANFVESVMAGIPVVHTMTPKAAVDEFEVRARALIPKDVKAMMKKYPDLIRFHTVQIRDADKTPIYQANRYWRATICVCVKVEDVPFDDLYSQVLAADVETISRQQLRQRITDAAMGATTSQRLAQLLPDLAGFIPKPAPVTYPVVPVGLVDDLKRAGLKVQVRSK